MNPFQNFHLFVLYARSHEVPKPLYDAVKKLTSIIHWRTTLDRNIRVKIEGDLDALYSLIPKYTYKQIIPYKLETLIVYAANLSRDYLCKC